MEELILKSFSLSILIFVLLILILWLFIKSAVKHGTKEAIMECYRNISMIEKDPVKKANFTKTPEEELQEELNNW